MVNQKPKRAVVVQRVVLSAKTAIRQRKLSGRAVAHGHDFFHDLGLELGSLFWSVAVNCNPARRKCAEGVLRVAESCHPCKFCVELSIVFVVVDRTSCCVVVPRGNAGASGGID
jgi:hypothetical protein